MADLEVQFFSHGCGPLRIGCRSVVTIAGRVGGSPAEGKRYWVLSKGKVGKKNDRKEVILFYFMTFLDVTLSERVQVSFVFI